MPSRKIDDLQKALERGRAAAAPAVEPIVREPALPMTPTSYKAPSREGKTNITAYLSPDYKASLRLIQSKRNRSLQSLMAEALNDLFTKYDVPTVRGE